MKRKNNTNKPFPPLEMQPDELDRIVGGMGDIITLFKEECRCGWISETSTESHKVFLCPACRRSGSDDFVHYAFLHGEWIRIEP